MSRIICTSERQLFRTARWHLGSQGFFAGLAAGALFEVCAVGLVIAAPEYWQCLLAIILAPALGAAAGVLWSAVALSRHLAVISIEHDVAYISQAYGARFGNAISAGEWLKSAKRWIKRDAGFLAFVSCACLALGFFPALLAALMLATIPLALGIGIRLSSPNDKHHR